MVALSKKRIIIIVLSSQYCVIVESAKIHVLLLFNYHIIRYVHFRDLTESES